MVSPPPRSSYRSRRFSTSSAVGASASISLISSHSQRPPLAPELAERIRQAMAVPGRPGIRVIAKQFGVSPMTVQNVAN
jgi:hypothetical protein